MGYTQTHDGKPKVSACGASLVKQVITPGAMIAGSIILGRALAPIQMIIGQWRGFNAARDAYGRLNAFYEVVPEDGDNTQLPTPSGQLAVENVIAGPPGAKTAVLTGLNFTLKPGQGLGVIGPSAAGKSTLARLLVGIWLPQKGAVRLDGATFDQWSRDDLYGEPSLIVLDEPNASLDAEGDAALTKAIAEARKRGKTVVVMAHRPSAIAAPWLIKSLQKSHMTVFLRWALLLYSFLLVWDLFGVRLPQLKERLSRQVSLLSRACLEPMRTW